MRVIAIFTLFILFSCSKEEIILSGLQTNNRLTSRLDSQVHALVMPYMNANPGTAVCIGLIKKDSVFFYSYGHLSVANPRLPDEHSLYEIGSVTKPFTAILLANAAAGKQLRLDDDIRRYLPAAAARLGFEDKPVTFTHLATHTSGLPRIPADLYTCKDSDKTNPFKHYDSLHIYNYLRDFKLSRQPGAKYEYSNLGMGLAGIILERIHKKSYEKLVTEQICNPLGMNDTRITLSKEQHRRLMKGHDSEGKPSPCWDFGAMAAGGGLHSSVNDLLKFVRANLGQAAAPLKSSMDNCQVLRFRQPQVMVGLGWHLGYLNHKQLISHDGRTAGFTSFCGFIKESGTAVVVLSNSSNHIDKISIELMKKLNH